MAVKVGAVNDLGTSNGQFYKISYYHNFVFPCFHECYKAVFIGLTAVLLSFPIFNDIKVHIYLLGLFPPKFYFFLFYVLRKYGKNVRKTEIPTFIQLTPNATAIYVSEAIMRKKLGLFTASPWMSYNAVFCNEISQTA